MIVQININLGSMNATEENIRRSFDRLMVAKEQHHVHDAHDWCTILDSNDEEEASLELLYVRPTLKVKSWDELQDERSIQCTPLPRILKSGDLREQHNTNTKEKE